LHKIHFVSTLNLCKMVYKQQIKMCLFKNNITIELMFQKVNIIYEK